MESDQISARDLPDHPDSAGLPRIQAIKARIKGLYHRYEKYSDISIFCLGFLWDSLTLTRVDSLLDNIILLFYLIIIGVMIFLTLRRHCGRALPKWIQKIEPHFLWAMQFCFGGLFSSYVIFYFKSASWTRTQFFFLVLVCLLIGNEFLQDRMKNPKLLAILYCFCLFTFFAFFLPVITAIVNEYIFVLAGLISLGVCLALFSSAMKMDNGEWHPGTKTVAIWIGSIVLLINILYFAHLIPPVPLALKSAGIYHQVTKTSAGYEVQYVAPSIWRFWKKSDDPFYWSPGEKVWCYTAIFAPAKARVRIFHVWSHKTSDGWVETDPVPIDITGGREGGFRGDSWKRRVEPGEWRVEVETEKGHILGRIDFTVVESPVPHPPLRTYLFQ